MNYCEIRFTIDMIASAYETTDPILICKKAYNDMETELTVSQVISYLNETPIKRKYSTNLKEVFDEN